MFMLISTLGCGPEEEIQNYQSLNWSASNNGHAQQQKEE